MFAMSDDAISTLITASAWTIIVVGILVAISLNNYWTNKYRHKSK